MESYNNLDLDKLNRLEKIDLLERLNELDKRLRYNKLSQWYPETGPYRRELYTKALDFFKAGATIKERVILGANRSGKSTTNNYESSLHLTGLYPSWWEGRRYENVGDILVWLSGDTNETVMNSLQAQLLGSPSDIGSGMIPRHTIVEGSVKPKHGIPNAIGSFSCHRADGSVGTCVFKSYEQGRKSFQAATVHHIQLDEEPKDPGIYSEAFTRTMTTDGSIVLGATPLEGLTDVVLRFMPHGEFPKDCVVKPTEKEPYISRFIQQVTWDDVPHLTEKAKREYASSYMDFEKEARMKGIPAIGAQKIYQIPEGDFTVATHAVPYSLPRSFGMDFARFGGNTAVVWGYYNEETDTATIYDVYKVSATSPILHAEAVRRRGSWVPGVIDPAAAIRNDNGVQWLIAYQDLGLNISLAKNAVDAGIMEMTNRLQDGRLKVMEHCTQWFEEYRLYRLDKNQKIARNQQKDLMDATRYWLMSALKNGMSLQDKDNEENASASYADMLYNNSTKDPMTGY